MTDEAKVINSSEQGTAGTAGTARATPQLHLARLYLGRMIRGVHAVTEESFYDFLGRHVTPRLPTFMLHEATHVYGGRAEPITIVEFFIVSTLDAQQRVAEIALAYRERFEQDTVLVTMSPVAAFEFEKEIVKNETEESVLVLP